MMDLLLKSFFRQITLCLNSGFTTTSCSSNCLTVMRIGNITGSKNPRYLCTGSIPLRNDIAYFIRFKIGFEDIRIRLMTDSQEKSIYRQCITFFIRFTRLTPSTPFSPNRPTALCSNNTSILSWFNTRSCMIFDARR